jgi:hypothetical protein
MDYGLKETVGNVLAWPNQVPWFYEFFSRHAIKDNVL